MKNIVLSTVFMFIYLSVPVFALAQSPTPLATRTPRPFATSSPEAGASGELVATESAELETPEPTPFPTARPDITQPTEETLGPLEKILSEQELGPALPMNPLKYAIRATVEAGVTPNTIVLLLLLPLVVAVIAAARHIVGLRGFGIFLPASLSIVFVAIGPIVGIGMFMVIVFVSTYARIVLRKLKLKLQYLPRMALILWLVVVGVLLSIFLAPVIKHPDFTNISIFPVLILVLMAEDFSKVQLGKSARTAITLASETIILALVSYIFLTMESLQQLALLYPEGILLGVLLADLVLGKYVGLRVMEYWRYRKLIQAGKDK